MSGGAVDNEALRDWIERARAGDADAFAALYDRFERSVYRLCGDLLDDPEAAAEVTQETFVEAWEKLGRLRHPAAFAAWLRSTAVNLCRHRRRRRWREKPWDEAFADEAEPMAEQPGVERRQEIAELGQVVREALGRLSPDHREVVVLHYLEQLPVADIAATLKVAPGTVKSRLSRAREHLERLLRPYVESAHG